jgi:adenylylsulfate reductase subunit A
MINGESYKIIVAEAAKNALKEADGQYFERVFITHPLVEGNKCVGAVGFSVRENKFYVFRAKATLVAMGGAVHVFKPRSTGEGFGRSWYPPFNSGASAFFTIFGGAEMTCQEVRFIPVRFKDAYGPVGAWFLLFKSIATNAQGGNYMKENAPELDKWEPYGKVKPAPANIRNWLMMLDVMDGKSPIYMQTADAIKRIADEAPDEKAAAKKLKELESEAWEDFLDMTISQAVLWAATNVEPEKRSSEIAAAEPYFIGSHSGASGAWVSGPEDLQSAETKGEYFWGYDHMSTIKGMFCAGDASGASSHKFSSGSHAEGRIVGKSAVKFIVENNTLPNIDKGEVEALKNLAYQPLEIYEQHKGASTDPEVNPNYIKPKQFMFRLQKIMDEYVAGVSSQFSTNEAALNRALELLDFLKEDSEKLAAKDLHELLRCWENTQRMWQAEAHARTILFREETRWPGYYMRADHPKMDEENWHVFANCRFDRDKKEWEMIKRPMLHVYPQAQEHELLGG